MDEQTLVIPRDEWLRGEEGGSRLCRSSDGKMCCLGIYLLRVVGIPREQLKVPLYLYNIGGAEYGDLGAPWQVRQFYPDAAVPQWTFREVALDLNNSNLNNSNLAGQLMVTNDLLNLAEHERERQITTLFAQVAVKVIFVDSIKTE